MDILNYSMLMWGNWLLKPYCSNSQLLAYASETKTLFLLFFVLVFSFFPISSKYTVNLGYRKIYEETGVYRFFWKVPGILQ